MFEQIFVLILIRLVAGPTEVSYVESGCRRLQYWQTTDGPLSSPGSQSESGTGNEGFRGQASRPIWGVAFFGISFCFPSNESVCHPRSCDKRAIPYLVESWTEAFRLAHARLSCLGPETWKIPQDADRKGGGVSV